MTGRRSRPAGPRGRVGPLAVACVLVPAATLGLGLVASVEPPTQEDAAQAESTPLSRATVVCPTAGQDGTVLVASDAGEPGALETTAGDRRPGELEVGPGLLARVEGPGSQQAVSLTGTRALAPGLTATRVTGPGLRAVACGPVTSDRWFVGVGAGAEHRSVLELHNPDAGPASVQISLLGQSGPVEERGLRGLTVAGGETVRLEVAELLPRREELAMRVQTTRGRLAVSVLDGFDEIGGGETREYVVGQAAPKERALLLGLPASGGNAALVVANPGEDVTRVRVRLVTEDAVFAPADLEEVQVPPGSVRRLTLGSLLDSEAAEGAVGLEVTASEPVVSTFRARRGGDLLTLSPAQPVERPTILAVPDGAKTLVLAGAEGLGTATITTTDAAGERLDRQRVELAPERAVVVELPDAPAVVRLEPERTAVQAAVALEGSDGVAVLAVEELVREGRVPAVRAGLP